MRIGMLVDMYKPHISGITNYVALNKRWLEQRGHKVFVFTFGDLDYEDDELYVIRSPGLPLNVNDTGFHLSFRYSPPAVPLCGRIPLRCKLGICRRLCHACGINLRVTDALLQEGDVIELAERQRVR